MATSSVHFEPTTRAFDNLTYQHASAPAASWPKSLTPQRSKALTNLLIGLSFVLAFVMALSVLYLGDQTFFAHPSVATSSQPAATYNGIPVDYD